MSKDMNNIGKAIVGTGIASAGLGLMLYGAGKALELLFRAVDPDKLEQNEEGEPERIGSGSDEDAE